VLGQRPVLFGKPLHDCEIKATIVVVVVVVMSLKVNVGGECGYGVGKPAAANHSLVAGVLSSPWKSNTLVERTLNRYTITAFATIR